MDHYKDVKIPARVKSQIYKTTCDLCGKKALDEGLHIWGEGKFDATETELRLKTGDSYPDGGYGEVLDIDICPDCFKEKLIPWLKGQGVDCTFKKWDW